MANVKISELPVAASVLDADSFPLVQGGVTKQVTKAVVFDGPAMTGTPTAPTAAPGTNTTQIATTAFVAQALTGLSALYPVGSIYMNATNSTNPATLLGFGTWVAFGAGRVPVGFDSGNPLFDTAEETGGSANAIVVSHTHSGTTDSAGTHAHSLRGASTVGATKGIAETSSASILAGTSTDSIGYYSTLNSGSAVMDTQGAHTHTFTTASAGSSGTNANYQPYITVYMWKRTA